MPARKFLAAAVFALDLLTVTAPAHAATIDYLAADVSLNFPSNIFSPFTNLRTLTGDISLQLYDSPPAPLPTDYRFTGDFSLVPIHKRGFFLDDDPSERPEWRPDRSLGQQFPASVRE
jgi:hypothetical protein